jgi:tetratricopeptide (TPR) repeat protein
MTNLRHVISLAALFLAAATFGVRPAVAATASPDAAQADPRTALLERDGWTAIAAGRAHDAADAFRQALAGDPRNARLHLGAAIAAFLERRDADARDAAERALTLDPALTDARVLLGQVQHRMGDSAAAIATYETLVAASPANAEAAATLDRWRREAELHGRMQQAIGAHFIVSFEGPAEQALADGAMASLDRAYWRIGAVLGTYPSDPIPVVLYTTTEFADITRSPAWAAGAFDGIIRVPMRGALANPQELDRVLAHEFTHALIRSAAARGVPAWVDEGLATALETEQPGEAERGLVVSGGAAPLSRLPASFGRLSGRDAALAYATSAVAVRRLLAEAGGVAVMNLVRDLGEGVPFDAAFLRRFQETFERFQATLF